MRPQRFEIGQAVTPKFNGPWKCVKKFRENDHPDPQFGKIYTVSSYWKYLPYHGWVITVEELSPRLGLLETSFDPVITDSQLEELLSEVPQTETVR